MNNLYNYISFFIVFKLKNDDFNWIDMKSYENIYETSKKSLITSHNVVCPQLIIAKPTLIKKPKNFIKLNFINNYEKYFPTIASNITIPTGQIAQNICENINKNQEILSIKGIITQKSETSSKNHYNSFFPIKKSSLDFIKIPISQQNSKILRNDENENIKENLSKTSDIHDNKDDQNNLDIHKNLENTQKSQISQNLAQKSQISKNIENSQFSEKILESPENLFFKLSLAEQNYVISQNFKNFQGINNIKPDIKEKYRNKEFLKVTKSLLIAHDNLANDLKGDNKRILGLATQDLINFSRFAAPNLIKQSIIDDNNKNYYNIQRHFGLYNEREDSIHSENTGRISKNKFLLKITENELKRKNGEIELLGKKMKTKFPVEMKIRHKKFHVADNEKKYLLSVKKINFKKSQSSTNSIASFMKKAENSLINI